MRLVVLAFTTDAIEDPGYKVLSRVYTALKNAHFLAFSIESSDRRVSFSRSSFMLYDVSILTAVDGLTFRLSS